MAAAMETEMAASVPRAMELDTTIPSSSSPFHSTNDSKRIKLSMDLPTNASQETDNPHFPLSSPLPFAIPIKAENTEEDESRFPAANPLIPVSRKVKEEPFDGDENAVEPIWKVSCTPESYQNVSKRSFDVMIPDGEIEDVKPLLLQVKAEPFFDDGDVEKAVVDDGFKRQKITGFDAKSGVPAKTQLLEFTGDVDDVKPSSATPVKKEQIDDSRIQFIRAALGPIKGPIASDSEIQAALKLTEEDTSLAINLLLGGSSAYAKRTNSGAGIRVSAKIPFPDHTKKVEGPTEEDVKHPLPPPPQKYLNPQPISYRLPSETKGRTAEAKGAPIPVSDSSDFPVEENWLHLGSSCISGLSTCRGRRLTANEPVDFNFPKLNSTNSSYGRYRSIKAVSEIVRFSTKCSGEIGRIPTEWAKSLIPLVQSGKVKVRGRCVYTPENLSLMQEILLYASLYIHRSLFTEGDTTWNLTNTTTSESINHPLLTLFRLLNLKPSKKADFTPEELDRRKRNLNLRGKDDDSEEFQSAVSLNDRMKGNLIDVNGDGDERITDEQMNKIVGTADQYDLEEKEAPETLLCELKPYQKQALHWMSELEKGIDVEKAAKTLHPCWDAYNIADKRASAVYINVFSGEATTKFPSATQMARGGILADAMGLGKTVMTIALLLTKTRGNSDEVAAVEQMDREGNMRPRVRCGTLIICPMALLGQWKDELENHCETGALSVYVHYGQDRTVNTKVIARSDVVLTTYGVLSAAFKSDGVNSIFHKVEWFRIVLDEAHTIKCSKTQVAQASFSLVAYSRWCLTGTPIQNKLEDLFSLLCFLHVDPWCNWAWWNKLIQGPYESGDQRGLRLVKAILRPLMLRRTKESTDKDGRPILTLPPVVTETIECEQSEVESDFYLALFKRSKVQFDHFVEQGKVLHNYASILELLLRLRQCCNHPFLVMSRTDTRKYTDMNKLAKRFLSGNSNDDSVDSILPNKAYVERVVEEIQSGEATECPICLETPEDAVYTSCAHRMCRDCLLSSWRTTSGGPCPICRTHIAKNNLITCPSENRFKIDIHKNWKESAKVSALLECLEKIQRSHKGEKCIVFSQWTSFLDLLEVPLKKKKIGFLRFDGQLGQKQRETVLHNFSESKSCMVMLMSLKAGGVGLNLTAANHVFIVDPWWNPAVEDQAVMRIHRIGQKRRVFVKRFIVKGTVEEKMQQVQERKQKMIAGALTNQEIKEARIEELKMLFR